MKRKSGNEGGWKVETGEEEELWVGGTHLVGGVKVGELPVGVLHAEAPVVGL